METTVVQQSSHEETAPHRDAGPIALRSYRRADLSAIVALDRRCFAEPFRFTRRAMRRFAESTSALSLVADRGGELVGLIIVELKPPQGYLVTLDVHPDATRRHLGSELLAAAEKIASISGVRTLDLHVHTGNRPAIRFYERNGFIQGPYLPNFYPPSSVGRGAFTYSKLLQS